MATVYISSLLSKLFPPVSTLLIPPLCLLIPLFSIIISLLPRLDFELVLCLSISPWNTQDKRVTNTSVTCIQYTVNLVKTGEDNLITISFSVYLAGLVDLVGVIYVLVGILLSLLSLRHLLSSFCLCLYSCLTCCLSSVFYCKTNTYYPSLYCRVRYIDFLPVCLSTRPCVCVWEREQGWIHICICVVVRETDSKDACVCVCARVCERERVRIIHTYMCMRACVCM